MKHCQSYLRALAESNPSAPSWLSERFEDPAARISDAGLAEANRRVDAAFLGPYGRGPGMDGLAEQRRENAARTEILNTRRQMIHEWGGRDDNPLLNVADPDGPLVPPPERAEAEADRTAEIDAQLRAAEIAQDGRGALLHHIGAAADRLRGLSPLPPKPAPKEDAPYVPTRWIGEGE